MALTITNLEHHDAGSLLRKTFDVTFDSSYATGGESLDPGLIGLQTIKKFTTSTASGYTFGYDLTNSKLQAFCEWNKYTVAVDPANHTAVASVNTDVTVTGVLTTDTVTVVPPIALEAGIAVQSVTVTGADTVRVRTTNASAGAINPASANWDFLVRNTSGALKEVLAATDLSALTVRCEALGY